jgi:hypothetical protein
VSSFIIVSFWAIEERGRGGRVATDEVTDIADRRRAKRAKRAKRGKRGR